MPPRTRSGSVPSARRTHAETRHAATPAAFALLLGVTSLTAAGCIDADTRAQMAQSESILGPLFKQQSPTEAAAWAADPYDADKRARGMNALAAAPFGGAEAYVNLYRERIKDDNAPVRAVAARALGLHGSPEDVERIVPLTRADEMIVRLEATRALQRLHNRAAVPALIERVTLAKETEPEVRAESASALGQYPDNAAAQALIAALADPNLVVNDSALSSLRTLTGNDDLGMDRKAWTKWMKDTEHPFANQRKYQYPVFWREKRWLDYVPFAPPVPNEQAAPPTGFTIEGR